MTARRNVRRAGPAARGGLAAIALATLAALGGCGQDQAGSPTMSSNPSSSAATGEAVDDSLTVTLDDGNGVQQTWQLSCAAGGSPAGDHPDGANACAALAAVEDPWAPVAPDMACTKIYGGPQVATVRGTWNGATVDARYQRTDGCEIARWDRLAPLLQPGTTTPDPSDRMG